MDLKGGRTMKDAAFKPKDTIGSWEITKKYISYSKLPSVNNLLGFAWHC